jgi:hypothetical protein
MIIRKYACILAVATGLMSSSVFAQQGLLRIVSPSSGTVVSPGQTVMIAVSADSSVEKLVLMGQHPLGIASIASAGQTTIWGRGEGESRPQVFHLTIPSSTTPGLYRITAMGRTAGGEVQSEAVALDVERSQDPVRIWAEPGILLFERSGDQIPLRVIGAFTGGGQEDLSKSSKVRYSSEDSRVATVNSEGMVTAISSGRTSIEVSMGSANYSIPVRVP